MTGKVYLVGAGPGDPGLITIKGMQALEKAQVAELYESVDVVRTDVGNPLPHPESIPKD